jgi:hypothetical protein
VNMEIQSPAGKRQSAASPAESPGRLRDQRSPRKANIARTMTINPTI